MRGEYTMGNLLSEEEGVVTRKRGKREQGGKKTRRHRELDNYENNDENNDENNVVAVVQPQPLKKARKTRMNRKREFVSAPKNHDEDDYINNYLE